MQYKLTNILEKISFYRISGIKSFIMIDIHKKYAHCSYIEIKEPFYQITNSKLIDSYSVIHSEIIEYGNDLSVITDSLKEISKKQNLDEGFIVVGINEFRFKTIKIDKDIGDKELWFFENINKFLPEGHQADDFLFSYEKYYENEENEYYYLNVARKNYIKNITNACQVNNLRVINVSTFPLAIHTLSSANEKNVLFLNVTHDKIIYSYSDDKNAMFYGESYITTNTENNNPISICLKEIKQSLTTLLPKTIDSLNIYFSSYGVKESDISHQLKSVFRTELINEKPFDSGVRNLNSIIVLNKLYTASDNSINLLPQGAKSENLEIVEKKMSMKLVLSLGALLVFLLLSMYFAENLIHDQIHNDESNIVEIDLKSKMIGKYKKENKRLIANLSLLGELKAEIFVYSNILYSIAGGIGDDGCLTKFIVKNLDNKLNLNIDGLAYKQKDVTNIVNRMEGLNHFNNVTLEYSNKIEKSKFRSKVSLPRKSMVDFSIIADYYENK